MLVLSAPPFSVSQSVDRQASTSAAIPGGDAEPNLAVELDSPREEPAPATTATLTAVVTNYGSAAADSAFVLRLLGDGGQDENRTIHGLQAGQSVSISASMSLPGYLNRIRAVVDATAVIQEGNESDNEAVTWVFRPAGTPLDAPKPVVGLRDDGSEDAAHPSFSVNPDRFSVSFNGPSTASVLVHRAWLESRLGPVGLEGAPLVWTQYLGQDYFVLPRTAGRPTLELRPFAPTLSAPLAGEGAPSSLLLNSRPMTVQLLSVPATDRGFRDVTNANGTFRVPNPPARDLAISLEDGNPQGQTMWISRAWLAQYGLSDPVFSYDDGSRIPAQTHGQFVLLQPPHFSVIHVFNTNPEDFQLVSDQPYSSVNWENPSGTDGRIRILAQRQDTQDESMVRDFIPHKQYTIQSTFGIEQQGNWQAMYPLLVANRTERAANSGNDDVAAPKSMGFYYYSRDTNIPITDPNALPQIQGYYTSSDGAKHLLWVWTSPTRQGWTVQPRIEVTSDTATIQLLSPAGFVLQCGATPCSAAVPKGQLTLQDFDVLSIGTEDLQSDTPEPVAIGWVDGLRVDMVEPNFLDEQFNDSGRFDLSGAASCCSNGVLQVTPDAANVYGRAQFHVGIPTSRFSAEYRYRIGPDGSGADGLVFMFDKNFAYVPTTGGSLGFDDADLGSIAGHEGYAVELDGFLDTSNGDSSADHISFLKDRRNNQLWSADGYESPDGQWHTVNVDVFDNKAVIYHDSRYLGTVNTGQIDRTFTDFGFAAATHSLHNYHQVDYLRISVPEEKVLGMPPDVAEEWLDVRALAQAVSTGTLVLSLADQSYVLLVQPNDLRAPLYAASYTDATGDHEVPAESIVTYRARVPQWPAFDSPLNLVDGFFSTHLSLPDCSTLVVQTKEGVPTTPDGHVLVQYWKEPGSAPPEWFANSTHEEGPTTCYSQTVRDACDSASTKCDDETANCPENACIAPTPGISPLPTLAVPVSFTRPATTITLSIALDADKEFYDADPSRIEARQKAMVNDMATKIWSPQLNINWNIVGRHYFTWAMTTRTACGDRLYDFHEFWTNGAHQVKNSAGTWVSMVSLNRDAVLVAAQIDMVGSTVGCAWQQTIGQKGTSGVAGGAYSIIQTKSLDSTEEYRDAAHEVGHIAGGDHAYARKWWYGGYWDGHWCGDKYTVMHPSGSLHCTANEFNNVGTTDHYNAWRIRYCAGSKSNCPSLIRSGT